MVTVINLCSKKKEDTEAVYKCIELKAAIWGLSKHFKCHKIGLCIEDTHFIRETY